MKFGIFMAPFHRMGENPTLAMKRDLKLLDLLDELGYDEAWIGEHHSFARELIADPVVFIAAAAQRTRRIKLGTGVLSLPYHHPFMVADRMLQLDHMTEGRAMLGVGPGALTSDAYMMGIEPTTQRRRMSESLDAIMALFLNEAPVTIETDWFTLREARLQMAPFSEPHVPVAVAASFTPAGPTSAGRHGVGLLSVAGADNEAFERTWGWVEESAAENKKTVNRGDWKVVMPIHVAESRQEAFDNIREGYSKRAYFGDRADPTLPAGNALFGGLAGATLEEQAERGAALIGTPDDVIGQIKVLQERSGGIGGILGLAHEWADTDRTNRSYELFQRYVTPHFQGQMDVLTENRNWIEGNLEMVFKGNAGAWVKAFEDAHKEMPEGVKQGLAAMAKAREEVAAKKAAAGG
jgi:limonene 1,2-monooxygenase